MDESKKRRLKMLKGLSAEQFQHPWDRDATRALESVPGFSLLMQKVMEYSLERVFYLENVASHVRVSEKNFPRVHKYARWAAQILDLELPEVYVSLDPQPNAYTYGSTKPFITVTSGLIEALNEEEQFYVVGHEMGHIKCGHTLYTLMANSIGVLVELVGQATFGVGRLVGTGIELALYDWQRKAELSADRAGLLCVQNDRAAFRSLMRLAGGARQLDAELDLDAFLAQSRAYEDADESKLNRVYKLLITAFRSHPYTIMRAKHLDDWVTAGGYAALVTPAPDLPPTNR
ncbi:M48 family metallopeptidase [Myxococcota bacterium]|nr:M48 family metallopeptidase [Myxococcota bacterium]